jgi:hypothetical protein
LARVLHAHRAEGYLFKTSNDRPHLARNVLRTLHEAHAIGFHSFGRYRAAVLSKAQVPDILVKYWLGHARDLSDQYAKQVCEDVAYRQEWCAKAGLGFKLAKLAPHIVAAVSAA